MKMGRLKNNKKRQVLARKKKMKLNVENKCKGKVINFGPKHLSGVPSS